MLCAIGVWVILGTLFFLPRDTSFAEITEYRSAQTVTTDGDPQAYTSLSNCSSTDGQTCDRENATGYANLYLKDFGDFGIPDGSTINDVRLRVMGMSTTAPYVGVSASRRFSSNCQNPTWLWQMGELQASEIRTFIFNTPISNGSLKGCLSAENIRDNNFVFRINWSGPAPWSASIDNFEIAFDYTPPQPIEPFLDLPWDYRGSNKTFLEAGLQINSFFDHEYPLLSTSMQEPIEVFGSLVNYQEGTRNKDLDYSSHDGYDWGTPAGLEAGTPVLAAAAGVATYRGMDSCGPCGNQIFIDHGNGYQTRYYHLLYEGLIVDNPNSSGVFVEQGQKIGEVGWTGNVHPEGEDGAHIHFMVVHDKNSDGNFEDNIPDGLVDPFGWQTEEPDPWENYLFFYNGQQRQGMKSHYLWTTGLDDKRIIMEASGGIREVESGSFTLSAQNGIYQEALEFDLKPTAVGEIIEGNQILSHGLTITALTVFGNPVSSFLNPVILTADFSSYDLGNIDVSTIAIYSSNDGINWTKENTNVDLNQKKATSEISHLTDFVLMAEKIDSEAPVTEVLANGDPVGSSSVFEPGVSIELDSNDNNGSGVDYIIYDLGEGAEEYAEPLTFTEEKEYVINYYAVDTAGNVESPKSFKFNVKKIEPVELRIYFDPEIKSISVSDTDSSRSAAVSRERISSTKFKYSIIDSARRSLTLIASDIAVGSIRTFTVESLSYSDGDTFKLDRNILGVLYKADKNKNIIELVQTFYQRGKEVIILSYTKSSGKTRIFVKEKGKDKLIQQEVGMKILQLYTDRGTLRYRY